MSDHAKNARRYRFYAEELRAIAGEDDVATTARQLRSIADGYDQLAASMDAVAYSRDKLKQI